MTSPSLPVWQADLRHANLPAVNFAEADLTHSYFAEGFGFIYAIAYSPDGALLAAATSNGEFGCGRPPTGGFCISIKDTRARSSQWPLARMARCWRVGAKMKRCASGTWLDKVLRSLSYRG